MDMSPDEINEINDKHIEDDETPSNDILESTVMNACLEGTTETLNNDVLESNTMDTSPDETNNGQFENFEPLFSAIRFAFIGDEQNIRNHDHYLIDFGNIIESFPYVIFAKRIIQKENWIEYKWSDFSFVTESTARDVSVFLSNFYKSNEYNFTPNDIDRIKRCVEEFSYKCAKPPKEIQKLENCLRFVQQDNYTHNVLKNLNRFKNIAKAINDISETDIQKIQDYIDNPNVIDSNRDKMIFHDILDSIQFDSLPTFDFTTIGSNFGFFYFKY